MSLSKPNEIYRASSRSRHVRFPIKTGKVCPAVRSDPDRQLSNAEPLTHLNDSILSQVAMSPLESFWFPGAKGDKVQGFLVKPPNFDASKKYPVKFLLHGGPRALGGTTGPTAGILNSLPPTDTWSS